MITKKRIMFLSANKMGIEIFKECINTFDAEYFVMTLSKDSNVVMYDSIENKKWHDLSNNVIEIKSIRAEGVKKILYDLKLDLIIMCGWRQILSQEFLNIAKLGLIAFHPTPLPIGRGPAPIINSILLGWKKSAVTLFFPDEGVDSGDIVDQEYFIIGEDDYAYDVYDKCIAAGKKLIRNNLKKIFIEKEKIRTKQDNEKATYLKKLKLKDNKICIDETPEMAYRKIRAFSKPYLGAFIQIGNKKIIIDRGRLCTKIKQS